MFTIYILPRVDKDTLRALDAVRLRTSLCCICLLFRYLDITSCRQRYPKSSRCCRSGDKSLLYIFTIYILPLVGKDIVIALDAVGLGTSLCCMSYYVSAMIP